MEARSQLDAHPSTEQRVLPSTEHCTAGGQPHPSRLSPEAISIGQSLCIISSPASSRESPYQRRNDVFNCAENDAVGGDREGATDGFAEQVAAKDSHKLERNALQSAGMQHSSTVDRPALRFASTTQGNVLSGGNQPLDSSRDWRPTQLRVQMQAAAAPRSERHSAFTTASRPGHRLTLQTLPAIGRYRPQKNALRRGGPTINYSKLSEHMHAARAKPTRELPFPTNAQDVGDLDLRSTNIEDAIGDLTSKIRRKSKEESAKHDTERETLKYQLQQALDGQGLLQARLKVVEQENENLSAAMSEQKTKVFGYQSKTSRLKAFVDGLGNDLAVVRKDSFAQRQQTEQLISDVGRNRRDHNNLLEQMSACTERSAQLKDEALGTLRKTKEQLVVATAQSSNLKEQLREKDRLLSEEKHIRSQLQSRLNDADTSSKTMTRQMKTVSDTILDKLFEIHATLACGNTKDDLVDMLGKIAAAIQALNSQQTSTVEEVNSVKGLVECISENLNSHDDDQDNVTGSESSLRAYLDETLRSLRAELFQHQQSSIQETADRAIIDGLKNDLATARSFKPRFEDAQKREAELKQEIVALKEQVAAQSNLEIERAEHTKLSDELQSAKAELQCHVKQLHELTTAKSTLEEQLKLMQQCNEAPEISATLTNTETQASHRIDQIRAEMAKHAYELRIRGSAETDNENKRLVHESARLARHVRNLEDKLASANVGLEKYRAERDNSNREMEELKRIVNAREAEVSGPEAAQRDLETAQDDLEKSRDEVKALKEQLAASHEKGEEALEKAEELRKAMEASQCKMNSAEDRESKLRTQVTGLQDQVRQAHEDAKQVGINHHTELHNAKAAVEKTANELRAKLSEATEELAKLRADNTGFIDQVRSSWKETAKSHEQTIKGLKADLVKAETSRNAALIENQKLVRGASPHRNATKTIRGPVVEKSQELAAEHTLSKRIRGPGVEESQDAELAATLQSSSPLTVATAYGKRMVDVPGTQEDSRLSAGLVLQRMDSLPSFAAFNIVRQTPEPDFSIYEDAADQSNTDNAPSRSGPGGSQDKVDRHTSSKSMPPPNSSLKLVRPVSGSQQSGPLERINKLSRSSFQTPKPRHTQDSNANLPSDPFSPHVMLSSSPEFITTVSSGRYLNQYQGSGKKQNEAIAGLGPARSTAKRKAESQIIDGYEHERKQRSAMSDATCYAMSQPLGLVRGSSMKDLPSIPRTMRSSAGTTVRQTRTAKRLTTSKEKSESQQQ
ncbi:hypothetical protein AC578_2120 [Pseudocercospora eumusae]|uniref:Uncharacterized protein n=1 Tax=Pseudocercospora eumusae TaxID=321146 RepID=A0A139HQA0_9PEZI|nr:hypothetical protein AC578_2120 [Pseudocercospora eumusae]